MDDACDVILRAYELFLAHQYYLLLRSPRNRFALLCAKYISRDYASQFSID